MKHPLDVIPTDQDRHNAAARAAIAARQQEERDRVYLLALGKFGPGYLPSGRHFLLDKADEDLARKTGSRPTVAATCYTVRHEETGGNRHFTIDDGLVTEHESYEAAFGPMLSERHPTRRIEVKGERVAPGKYSLCWAPIETYTPRSPESLAAARATREKNKAEKLERELEEYPPLKFGGLTTEDMKKGRGR